MKKPSKTLVMAGAIGFDVDEMGDYRYHSTRTSTPVWTIEDTYYTITRGDEEPTDYLDGWEQVTEFHIPPPPGFTIWKIGR